MTGLTGLLTLVIAFQGQGSGNLDAESRAAWRRLFDAHVEDYRISPNEKDTPELRRLPRPVLLWDQPITGSQLGAVYVWVNPDGQPAALGTIFALGIEGGSGLLIQEFHSLTDRPLKAVWRGRPMGGSSEPGLRWTPIARAPRPAESARGRTAQMRSLARQFEANFVDPAQGRWELRLLPKPLYTYETARDRLDVSGGVFVFCHGRDPEIILAVRARPAADGPRWEFACARFSEKELHVRRDGTEVWHSPDKSRPGPEKAHWVKVLGRISPPTAETPEGKKI